MDRDAEIERLRAQLADREARLADARRENEELRVRLAAAEEVAARLQRDLERLKRQAAASKSERVVDPNQLLLPVPGATSTDPVATMPAEKPAPERKSRRGTSRRRKISEMNHLETVEFRSTVEDRACPCCGEPMQTIGEHVSWRIERIPAQIVRHKVVQEKVACPHHPEAGVTIAEPAISYALPKAMCGNGLLAQVAIDKYADHLPLHRQAERFRREGLPFSRSTLCGWMMQLAELLRPIATQLARQARAGPWVRADATGMPVRDETRAKGRTHHGHLWAWGNYEIVVFQYTPTKKAEVVASLFEGFEGTVLIDGATDFNLLEKAEGVKRAGCWAHARRYWYEAMTADARRALTALGTIRQLFMAERIVMAAPVENRIALRDDLCRPILDGFRAWIDQVLREVEPGGPVHKAARYVVNQWDRLVVFLETAEIACHNNDTERDLRRPVKGKRNYLYCGSPRGAEAAAVFYSLVGTCLLQGIDPHAYLIETLARLDEPPARLTPMAIREEWQGAVDRIETE